jgi:hypothetical protein
MGGGDLSHWPGGVHIIMVIGWGVAGVWHVCAQQAAEIPAVVMVWCQVMVCNWLYLPSIYLCCFESGCQPVIGGAGQPGDTRATQEARIQNSYVLQNCVFQ